MKAILISTLGFIGSVFFSMLLTRLITTKKRRSGRLTRRGKWVIFSVVLILVYLTGGMVYFSIFSHASENAMVYMNSTDTVSVSEIDDGYLFDGPGTENAFIFYPGAKVDEKAYAELMMRLADEGTDCFLISMPLHMAILGKRKADNVIEAYSGNGYKHWYIGGHSLGGAVAAIYAAENSDKLDGVVMLAAYSTKKLDQNLKAMTMIATNDHVINTQDYEENKKNLPPDATEVVIQGGNHSQFGDYGDQRGDGEATITRDDQIKQVCEAILHMLPHQQDIQTDLHEE